MAIDDLDFDRHAVLEASAGTGKTHAIVQVVLRLLREGRCQVENILLVTFTEKATGDLKDRLRGELESAIDKNPELAPSFQPALDHYDQAPVFTIHGFCNWLLRNYAAELGQDFQFDLVHDRQIIQEVLRLVQKHEWHRRYGSTLADILKAAQFRGKKGSATWEKLARELAERFRPAHDHLLVPAADADPNSLGEKARYQLASKTVAWMQTLMHEIKLRRGQVSYEDMIQRVEAGLDPARNPRAGVVQTAVRNRFSFAVVDEFQDTDPLQWKVFRRLFLEGGASKLFIVGDPKQAIYGFRGADLPTYFKAASEMRTERNAQEHPLDTNWRATPEMIAALNQFFGDGKFFPPESRLTYRKVTSPPDAERRGRIISDFTGTPAVTLFDVRSARLATAGRAKYSELIVCEIRRLLSGNQGEPLLEIKTRDTPRPLRGSDICLLVFRRREADDVTQLLTAQKIPWTFYKKSGMYSTPEASDLRHVLRALVHPDEERYFRRALLTQFFRFTPGDLIAAGSLSATHPARILFNQWLTLAQSRDWAGLFSSLLEKSGLLLHEREHSEYERKLTNLRFLLGRLEQAAYKSNLDLVELWKFATETGSSEGEEDWQPQESEDPRVQIMTIHSAKGLEFPVVFLLGGFTEGAKDDIKLYRDNDQLVFDLALIFGGEKENPRGYELCQASRRDEQRRLLYVALTRAQFKLYLPYFEKAPKVHNAPLPTLVAPALVRSGLLDGSPHVAHLTSNPIVKRTGVAPPLSIAASTYQVDPLFPTIDPDLWQRRVVVRSFTGLRRQVHRDSAATFGDASDRGDELPDVLQEAADPFRGTVFGELVHKVLEEIDYAEVRAARSADQLDRGFTSRLIDDTLARFLPRLTARNSIETNAMECRRLVIEIVWNALQTPLSPLGGRLCELSPEDRIEELEFIFSTQDSASRQSSLHREEWMMKGFMDLVFRWRNRVYLLDWKTNTLPQYERVDLARAMDEADYTLQYKLYWDALSRWLRRVYGVKFDEQRHLGGVFYLFVRGMNGRDDSTGVYFTRPA